MFHTYGFFATFLVCFAIGSVVCAPAELQNRTTRSLRQGCNCGCGISKRHMRVVGGDVSKMHEFPWIAGISRGGEFHCGASLITRRHVVTAAHCVNGFNMDELTITLADHNRESSERVSNIVVRGVKNIREHEHFDIHSFNNDIAVLELDQPVEFDNKVQPVCLPENDPQDYSGQTAIIAGWGRTEEKGEPSSVLRKVSVPVWTKQQCHDSGYGKRKISENMFCAGYPEGQRDACQGDSGGPLQMSNSLGDMELIGVVSWGRGCARPNLPGVYTKVNNYLHWVEETLQGECLCQPASQYFGTY